MEPFVRGLKYKLGKLPPKRDDRNIKMKNIIRGEALPVLPEEWAFYKQYPQFDLTPQVWGNDQLGDCAYVASIAQQREFEVIEQKAVIPVALKQLEASYLKEAGGDTGLCMLDHLKVWKSVGLPIGYTTKKMLCFKRKTPLLYQIDAFAEIDTKNQKEIMYAVYLLGCNMGFALPDSFQDQFEAGHTWDDTSLPPNPEKGHCMKPEGWSRRMV